MLALTRKVGEFIEITHRSGDVLRIELRKIERAEQPTARLVFGDAPHNFQIDRPEYREKMNRIQEQAS